MSGKASRKIILSKKKDLKDRIITPKHGVMLSVSSRRKNARSVVRSGIPEDTPEELNRLVIGFGRVVAKNSRKLDREKYNTLLAQRVRDMMDL